MIKTTQNYQSDQMTMNCMHLTSNWQKCRVLSQNIQNNAKLQKWSKYNDFASIWCQNDQNNAKLPKRSNYDELHAFDVELVKMSSFVTKHSKQRKTPKVIKIQWLESMWCRIGKNVEFCHKTFKRTQNSKSDQNTMIWIDLMSNCQKCRVLSKNIQNNAKLQKWSKYNDLHRFDFKMIKTTQNYQSDQITMNCMHLTSNWQKCRVLWKNIQNNAKFQKWSKYNDLHRFDVELSKMSSFIKKHSKQRKTPKVIKIQWLASIWFQNDQNNAKLPKRSNYDELHAFDVELAKMSSFVKKHSKQRKTPKVIKIQWLESIWCRIGKNVEFCHKTFKTTQNSKSDQNTMTCVDLMLKWSKQRKTTKSIKLRWIAWIWRRIGKNVEFCQKTFKTTQNSKSDQNTMTWIDLMSNWQKCRVLSQNIQNNAKLCIKRFDVENDQNNAKLPNRSNYDELHGFDVELAKMSSFVTKHSKQRKTPKVIKVQWLCIDLMSKWSKQRKTTKSIKLRWIAWIWRRIGKNVEFCQKTFKTTQKFQKWSKDNDLNRFDVKIIKTTQNYQIDQITMNCIHLTSNWQKCRVLSQNIQNNAKLQKWSKYNDFASIWCQNDQNNAKVPKRSNYDELHAFDVELAKMSSFVTKHSKQRKTPKVIKVQWLCIDLMSKWSKQRKTTKEIKLRWIACIWRRIGKNVEFCYKTFKTTQISKSDQNTMTCIDLMLKWSKQRKTTKSIKLRWIAYIWRRIGKNVEFCHKTFKQRKTPKVIKVQWLCIDLMSKCSRQRKTTKAINLRWIACIWRLIGKNVEFCHKTFKTTQNSKSDQSTMTLHRFDVKMIKTTQNYQIDQITMNWVDLTSNWPKCRVLSQNIQNNAKLQKWSKYNDFASIWCQNDQNNAKLSKWSNYDELHAFYVELAKMSSFVTKHSKQRKNPKVIKIQWLESIWFRIVKNVVFCQKTFKTTQNSKSDQNTMTCIDPMLKWSKQRKTTKSIKLRWIACIWRRIGKNVEFCHKTFKTTQNSKSDQSTMTLHRFDAKMIKTTQNYQID